MQAYLNNPALKTFLLDQLSEHRRLDHFIKGDYWKDGRGCAVGCTLESVAQFNGKWRGKTIDHSAHALYESELGIPLILAYLHDRFFESLPEPDYLDWPRQFAEAIPTGADLSEVWPKFVVVLLTDPTGPIWPHVQDAKFARQKEAIERVAQLFRNGMPARSAASEAASAASAASAAALAARSAASAAWSAARSAASAAASAASAASAAALAAWSAERSAARSAERSAARSAASAASEAALAARSAARSAAWRWERETLLRLLREAR